MKTIPDRLGEYDYESLVEECNKHFPLLLFPIVDFTNSKFFFRQQQWGGINVVYRARHIADTYNYPHENITDISYIPEDKLDLIEKFGRVNKPKESMFYGALKLPTACTEAITKGNVFEDASSTMLSVGVWKFETPLKLVEIPHSEKYFKSFYDEVNFKSEKIQLDHIRETNQKLRDKIGNDTYYEQLMFFADAFARWDIKEDNQYMLSNYFADRAFNKIPGYPMQDDIDGIIYPSIAFSYQETNIVLKPEVVKEKMKFISALQIWLVSFLKNNGGAQFNPIDQNVKTDEKGNLNWRFKKE